MAGIYIEPLLGPKGMSIQDSQPISYADHDVQHIRHRVCWRSDADSGPSDSYESIEQYEITDRGLDPDELAELRAMRVTVSMYQSTTVNQGNPGSVLARIGAGFNLSGDEFLQADSTTQAVDVDNSGTDDFVIARRSTDEVGQLYTALEDHDLSFNSTGNSLGGGAGDNLSQQILNFNDLFGSGPFVDAADDFSSRIQLVVNDVLETVCCEVGYSLYYDVNQTEGGRSRFGR